MIDGRLPMQEGNRVLELEDRVKDIMLACGMDEVLTYSITYSGAIEKLASLDTAVPDREYRSWDTSRSPVTIVNPLSSRQDVMRPTLLPNMLDTLRNNLKTQPETPVRIFEVGKVYLTPTEEEVQERLAVMKAEREKYPRMQEWEPVPGEERLPIEHRRLMGVMSGPRYPRSRFKPDPAQQEELDFFDAKGVVEELLHHLHISNAEFSPTTAPVFHSGRVATVRAGGIDLGVLGELHPSLVEEWELPPGRVCVWDLDLEALVQAMPGRNLYAQVSPYTDRQDMAFVVSEETPAAVVAGWISKAGGDAVTDVSLFDIYTGKPIPEGKKSLAFAITLASNDKPLTEEELARLRKRISGRLERELGAELRT
jgi:phenylalanyl-tRNA synthetase beta chain